ncbi:HigA family addiction module antidote protein [Candidatus Peregrinibacteria bacterium]|nr:HigA family addiction module antidote protein [Candidatus Peregrinibacteria bacterium]
MIKTFSPIHPGEILEEEFMKPLKVTQYRVAKDIGVPPIRVSEIMRGKRGITADTALRLGKYFGNSAEFWMNLQMKYDLLTQERTMEKVLKSQVKTLQFLTA